MKLINRIYLLLLFGLICYSAGHAQETSYFLHTIERGQSLYSISTMYNVTTSDIIRLNPGCEDRIYAGQSLKIPKAQTGSRQDAFHTIQPGETLYRLSTVYKVSSEAICEANPGLSAENFRAGQVVRIPLSQAIETASERPARTANNDGFVQSRCKDMHRVKRKETIFSVSREYGITEKELIAANPELKDGMKKGQLLCIPYPSARTLEPNRPKDATETSAPDNNTLFDKTRKSYKNIPIVRTALLLPFQEDKRMLEYYEGMLMAIDSLKRTGTSIDLHVYDCSKGSSTLNNILNKAEMKNMDLIIGPMYQEQIRPLADFAQRNGIRLVVPFSSKDAEVFKNPFVYQINTPQSYLYSEVYEHFFRQFGSNINAIFINSGTPDKEKAEFVKGLKEEMSRRQIPMASISELSTQEAIKSSLRNDRTNIFIPTSGSNLMLNKVLPQLTLLVRESPASHIKLFGYPEWQTYTRDHLDSFFELDTYFYSSFYTNTLFPAAVQFSKSYYKWYGKELASKYPSYAMLGFDTGYFFMKNLSRYGSQLEDQLSNIKLTPIQTGFKFERVNNWGGFINKKVFFIHFTRNFELEKLDYE